MNVSTGYAEVDEAIAWFARATRAVLVDEFVGMYLYGSLALGDFDPATSDIDFIVVTRTRLTPPIIAALAELHSRFDSGASPWRGRIEAAYVERTALGVFPPTDTPYPQVETNRGLVVEPLEPGWLVQCWTLRHRGVVIAGPPPTQFVPPLDPNALRATGAPIARQWQHSARTDPS